jgi:hypothetical protein
VATKLHKGTRKLRQGCGGKLRRRIAAEIDENKNAAAIMFNKDAAACVVNKLCIEMNVLTVALQNKFSYIVFAAGISMAEIIGSKTTSMGWWTMVNSRRSSLAG